MAVAHAVACADGLKQRTLLTKHYSVTRHRLPWARRSRRTLFWIAHAIPGESFCQATGTRPKYCYRYAPRIQSKLPTTSINATRLDILGCFRWVIITLAGIVHFVKARNVNTFGLISLLLQTVVRSDRKPTDAA